MQQKGLAVFGPKVAMGLNERARKYLDVSKAANTFKAYLADLRNFEQWCAWQGITGLPLEEDIANYITHLADNGYKVSTIRRRLATISIAYKVAQLPNPTRSQLVREVWAGIKKKHGVAQKAKEPLLVNDIKHMVSTLPEGLLGIRDRALLLLGFAGAFRRSELVGLDVEDIGEVLEGLKILIPCSKTDQEGHGEFVGIPYGSYLETCPVRSYKVWIMASGINTGPVFRPINRHGQLQPGRLSAWAVSQVVKRTAKAAGLNPEHYSAHSLRSGLATSAAIAGKSERIIMQQTRHKSQQMVRRYIREASLFRENAAADIGL